MNWRYIQYSELLNRLLKNRAIKSRQVCDKIKESQHCHYAIENDENQHTFIRRSEVAFPSARHSVVK